MSTYEHEGLTLSPALPLGFDQYTPPSIEYVHFFHGWTLSPDDGFFKKTAEWLEQGFGISTSIPQLPDTNTPNREAWEACINETVTEPEKSILVLHSLSGINGIRYAAHKMLGNPDFRLGGILGVGVNISPYVSDEPPDESRDGPPLQSPIGNCNLSPKAFDEIASHFDPDYETFATQTLLARAATHQRHLIYGSRDQFVSLPHAAILGDHFGARVWIDPNEAHFSGEYHDPRTGRTIPACTFNLNIAFILAKMIMNVAPEGRYDSESSLEIDCRPI